MKIYVIYNLQYIFSSDDDSSLSSSILSPLLYILGKHTILTCYIDIYKKKDARFYESNRTVYIVKSGSFFNLFILMRK